MILVAINNVGLCYDQGKGTPKNPQKAFEMYSKSAEGGYAVAIFNVGVYNFILIFFILL